jgi:hypothetical protein
MIQNRKELILSGKGLTNLESGIYEKDFTFVLADARYECPLFIATFLSSRVAGLLCTDPTIRELVLKARDPNHFFTGVLGLGEGRALEVTAANSEFLAGVGIELGNQEITASTLGPLAADTVLGRLRVFFELSEKADSEIEFCSSHFYELNWDEFDRLPIEILQAILSHQLLKLKDEDSLFALVGRAVARDARFAVLFENGSFTHRMP